MKENKLIDLSMDFSVTVLKAVDSIKGHYALVNQIERSATSIGANIHEANYAQSKADFISKLQNCSQGNLRDRVLVKTFSKSKPT